MNARGDEIEGHESETRSAAEAEEKSTQRIAATKVVEVFEILHAEDGVGGFFV